MVLLFVQILKSLQSLEAHETRPPNYEGYHSKLAIIAQCITIHCIIGSYLTWLMPNFDSLTFFLSVPDLKNFDSTRLVNHLL